MSWIQIALPGTILALKFLLKLFVDKSATWTDGVSAVLALPVDVLFLAASLVAALVIASPDRAKEGLILFIVFVGLAVLAVVLWRRSDRLFVADRHMWCALAATVNFLISFGALVAAVQEISGGAAQ
jgi:hypothetical protein